ncbi:MAG: hypothetical protein U0941_07155 [Planctomycetaceae bacterium]
MTWAFRAISTENGVAMHHIYFKCEAIEAIGDASYCAEGFQSDELAGAIDLILEEIVAHGVLSREVTDRFLDDGTSGPSKPCCCESKMKSDFRAVEVEDGVGIRRVFFDGDAIRSIESASYRAEAASVEELTQTLRYFRDVVLTHEMIPQDVASALTDKV